MPRPIPLLIFAALCLSLGCGDRDQPAGRIEGPRRAVHEDPDARSPDGSRRILFGDLHAHTTYSIDAFIYSLPLFGGEGAHPPADACDFARYCSNLDFFSVTDHAEGLTPDLWERIVASTRECNALAGEADDPDVVAFLGWEWTQAGHVPEAHYGHKNVILRGLDDAEIPARPINSLPDGTKQRAPPGWIMSAAQGVLGSFGLGEYADFLWFIQHMAAAPDCATGVDVRELPIGCMENAPTPAVLFEKLRQWDVESIVIPHGLAWGLHAPPGSHLGVQLDPRNHDPERQRLLEVFSGHGNSEEFRPWSSIATDDQGGATCPAPSEDFEPCCWRAGEIARQRCGDMPAADCERNVAEARHLALEAGVNPHRVFPDTDAEDWLDCDQCRDCFKPAYSLRPRQSAQYALALGNFAGDTPPGDPLRFRFGFIGSSDDHKAQPGTGYKQVFRKKMSDARGISTPTADRWVQRFVRGEPEDPRRATPAPQTAERGFRSLFGSERVESFLTPGGLVAVHAEARDRSSIWRALHRREVYGTSGPRILLWFDLLNAPAGRAPMGSEVVLGEAPRFEVRAVGAFEQQPGCPEESHAALTPERLAGLCGGECHNPGEVRHPIRSIEIVRILPQQRTGEDVALLIEDPWRSFPCAPDPNGCRIEFEDTDAPSDREAIYYARALQEPTLAVNGANLRTEFGADGNAVDTWPCYGGYQTPVSDDCLAPVQERAFSSPIFVGRGE